jgi:hypothetical protein
MIRGIIAIRGKNVSGLASHRATASRGSESLALPESRKAV